LSQDPDEPKKIQKKAGTAKHKKETPTPITASSWSHYIDMNIATAYRFGRMKLKTTPHPATHIAGQNEYEADFHRECDIAGDELVKASPSGVQRDGISGHMVQPIEDGFLRPLSRCEPRDAMTDEDQRSETHRAYSR